MSYLTFLDNNHAWFSKFLWVLPCLALSCSEDGDADQYAAARLGSVEVDTLSQALTGSVDRRVAAGNDDAEQRSNGSVYRNSSDLELIADGSRQQTVGMRFTGVAVPQGATVTNAYVEFTTDETNSGTTNLTFRAQDADDPPAFGSGSNDITARPVTSASVAWSPSAWNTVGQKHQTPNLAPVIQEVVGRSGWVSGNAMVIIVTGTGERTAEAYEGSASQAALLHIEYDTGTAPSCGDGSCNGTETCSTCTADCGSCGGGSVPTQQNLLVAFIGDQGNNGNSTAVLQLIAAEGAHAVVHNGDFDYADNPSAWDNRITSVLGDSYPYFAVVGNHDAAAWSGANGYAAKIAARHARNPEMACSGELGVKASCNFRGLHLIESCVGTSELRSSCGANSADQVNFIEDTLASSDAIFKVCNWHKNQNQMQVGTKSNEVGWVPYQTCMEEGAIISTGHEHSYSRTKTLTDIGNSGNAHGATGAFNTLTLGSGQSFVFVSGLAGAGIRPFASSHASESWWASYYTSDRWYENGVTMSGTGAYGALFIRFYVDGDPNKARAYFKDVNGRIVDEFTIYVQ